MLDSDFLKLVPGCVVSEGGETYIVVSLNNDNTDTLKRQRDGVIGMVTDDRLKAMKLIAVRRVYD